MSCYISSEDFFLVGLVSFTVLPMLDQTLYLGLDSFAFGAYSDINSPLNSLLSFLHTNSLFDHKWVCYAMVIIIIIICCGCNQHENNNNIIIIFIVVVIMIHDHGHPPYSPKRSQAISFPHFHSASSSLPSSLPLSLASLVQYRFLDTLAYTACMHVHYLHTLHL